MGSIMYKWPSLLGSLARNPPSLRSAAAAVVAAAARGDLALEEAGLRIIILFPNEKEYCTAGRTTVFPPSQLLFARASTRVCVCVRLCVFVRARCVCGVLLLSQSFFYLPCNTVETVLLAKNSRSKNNNRQAEDGVETPIVYSSSTVVHEAKQE